MNPRYVCIHGHYYQPPRENPWLGEVELQDSARPFHDWNERITAECYGPNANSRILGGNNEIIHILNNYSMTSFNFGPTLLSWMERHQPDVYEAIIEADKLSMERFDGHGSAMAQVFNHMIMPLANRDDKYTQVLWGVQDFRHRFGRDPEGMWLPETAVDIETLEILALFGITFTLLAPRQASRVRRLGAEEDTVEWTDVSDSRIDPTTPYLCKLPSGASITLFFYDGPISQELAFSDLLGSGESFKERLMDAFTDDGRDWPQLVHIATDGETYGHHHTQGEMALSWSLYLIDQDPSVQLTNYSQYLALHPPQFEVKIFDNSSWSCIHGVERWRADCGCNSGMHGGWTQAWRQPLRQAMNWLGETTADVFEDLGPRYFNDPWKARNAYGNVVLDRSLENVQAFMAEHSTVGDRPQDTTTALKLLEMQRFSQLIYTSCGWFFDEISGIETVQILQYAVRAIQLAEELSGRFIEDDFIALLERAPSNVFSTGAEAYRKFAKPARVDLLRVAAHYAISSLFEEYHESYDFAAYHVSNEKYERVWAGRSALVTGKAQVTSRFTRDSVVITFAVLHAGDHNLTCGVRFFTSHDAFRELEKDLRAPFERGDITETIRKLDSHFGKNTYSIWHLFRDAQRRVVHEVLTPAYQQAEASYRQIYEANYPLLNFLEWLDIPVPRHFLDAAKYVVNNDLEQLFDQEGMDIPRLEALIAEAQKWSLPLDDQNLGYRAARWVRDQLHAMEEAPQDTELMDMTIEALGRLEALHLGLHLWKAQNAYYRIGTHLLEEQQAKADKGDRTAGRWLRRFLALGELLKVRMQ